MSAELAPYLESSGLEKVLEHRFVAELSTCLWLDGCRDVEVLRSEVDAHGYDLVIEANGMMRHIQLKSMIRGGKKQHVTVNTRLAAKPAGCVIWFDYDPLTLELGPLLVRGTAWCRPSRRRPGRGQAFESQFPWSQEPENGSSGRPQIKVPAGGYPRWPDPAAVR